MLNAVFVCLAGVKLTCIFVCTNVQPRLIGLGRVVGQYITPPAGFFMPIVRDSFEQLCLQLRSPDFKEGGVKVLGLEPGFIRFLCCAFLVLL